MSAKPRYVKPGRPVGVAVDPDLVTPEEEMARKLALECGPDSAVAHALAELDRRRAAGRKATLDYDGRTFHVWG